jgi:hypothetical protein
MAVSCDGSLDLKLQIWTEQYMSRSWVLCACMYLGTKRINHTYVMRTKWFTHSLLPLPQNTNVLVPCKHRNSCAVCVSACYTGISRAEMHATSLVFVHLHIHMGTSQHGYISMGILLWAYQHGHINMGIISMGISAWLHQHGPISMVTSSLWARQHGHVHMSTSVRAHQHGYISMDRPRCIVLWHTTQAVTLCLYVQNAPDLKELIKANIAAFQKQHHRRTQARFSHATVHMRMQVRAQFPVR